MVNLIPKKRFGYALLFTIFIIFAITIILSQILFITNKSIQSSNQVRNYIQLYCLKKDIIKLIKQSSELKNIKDADSFDAFLQNFSFIPIKFKDGSKAIVKILPSSNTININEVSGWKKYQKDRFLSYLRNYGVISPDYFLNLLIDVETPKSTLTDIKTDLPSLNSTVINKWRDFEKIEQYYIKITKDYNILNVPWKKIISFYGNEVDANYMSCDLWNLVYSDSSNNIKIQNLCHNKQTINTLEDLSLSDDEIKDIKKFGITTDTEKVKVIIKLLSKNKKDIISSFFYNIRTKKVSNVSMAF